MKVESSKILAEKKPILQELLDVLLKDFSYASILATDSKGKTYRVSGSGTQIGINDFITEVGYVVKVYDGESYGEYAFNHISKEMIFSIAKHVKESLVPWKKELTKNGKALSYPQIPDENISFVKSTEFEVDPESVSEKEIIERMTNLRAKVLKQDESLVDTGVMLNFQKFHKLFLSPNKDLEQNVLWTECAMFVLSPKGDEMKEAFKAVSSLGGLENLDELDGKIPEILTMITRLKLSEQMKPGMYDCICTPDVTGLIVHEAFGHGVEMDMFVKDRALAKEYMDKQVASELVTMHDGAACTNGPARYFFDDEGTIAQDTVVIDKGILKAGMCDAHAGMQLDRMPSGNGRRQSSSHKAYSRMTNTFFEAGKDKVEDMIASIEYGFLLEGAGGGMEDPKNWGIQCSAQIAREIKDGKFTGKCFSPVTMTGYVPDLLKSISMMSDEIEIDGAGWCGKGHKEWAKVSMGGPYIKARIRLG